MENEHSRGVDALPGLVGTALADNTSNSIPQPLSGIITNAGISLRLLAAIRQKWTARGRPRGARVETAAARPM